MNDREAMKMALKDFKHIFGMRFSLVTNAISKGNIERLEAALAQPERGASMNRLDLIIDALSISQNSVWSKLNEQALAAARELQALAQPEQEPVGWFAKGWQGVYVELMPEAEDAIPFYTAPQSKPWVGLHLDDMPESYAGDKSFLNIARWAEAKLKEKNA